MKAKTAVIAVITAGAVTGGSIYGAYQYTQSHKEPVKVMPVSTANLGAWFFDDDEDTDSLEGTIFSKNTQTVNLASDKVLTKVYVETGDTVKIGDPLLEYDMTLTELQLEMEEILMERLGMTLEKQEKQLAQIKANPNAASVISTDDEDGVAGDDDTDLDVSTTTSADLIEDAGSSSDNTLPDGLSSADIFAGDTLIDDETYQQADDTSNTDSSTDITDNSGSDTETSSTNADSGVTQPVESETSDTNASDASGEGTSGSQDTPSSETSNETPASTETNTSNNTTPSASSETSEAESKPASTTEETAPSSDSADEIIGDDTASENSGDITDSSDISGDDLLMEEEDGGDLITDDSDLAEDVLIDDGLDIEGTYVIDGEVIYVSEEGERTLFDITEFRAIENRLRQQEKEDYTQLSTTDIARALQIFQDNLSDTPAKDRNTIITVNPDVFGVSRDVSVYLLSDSVNGVLTEAFSDTDKVNNHKERLYRAYINVLYYDLLTKVYQLNQTLESAGINASTITPLQAEQLQDQILPAITAYYEFMAEWEAVSVILEESLGYSGEDVELIYSTYYKSLMQQLAGTDEDIRNPVDGLLSRLADKLNYQDTIETEEPVTETPETDFDDDFPDGPDFDDIDDTGLTQDEIREMIREQETAIAETKLQIREKAIKIRQYERSINEKVVKATINGIVKSAGSVDGTGTDDSFIVVSGEQGLYVTVNVNELKLDQIQVGDTVTGTSYETNGVFTGVVTEISQYPSDENDGNSWFWYYGSDSDNSNASFYPVTAYIEDAEDLLEGSATVQIQSNGNADTGSGNLYLENYFVRTDSTGQAYVYIQGSDGLLKKQYVRTGGSLWGTGVEIKSGISTNDYIAFPYGKNVVEGAETLQVETIEEY